MIAVSDVTIPRTTPVPSETLRSTSRKNFIDELVWQKLQRLNIVPSPFATITRSFVA